MALTHDRVLTTADAVAQIATETVDLITRLRKIVVYNQHQAIDWGAQSTPAYLEEDAAGNIAQRPYSRQQVANAVGTLAMLDAALTDGHLGNLNHLARPLGNR